MNTLNSLFLISSALLGGAAQAAINGVAGGDGAPPSLLGAISVVAFPADPVGLESEVSFVASPLGGTVDFSVPLYHTQVGVGWGSWSHGYLGDVYFDLAGGTDLTLTLPAGTLAFYLYAEPADLQPFDIEATSLGGTTITQSVDGDGGASLFGFFATGGDVLASITVSSTAPFAVGEFGIGNTTTVPEASTWGAAAGIALLGMLAWRRRA